MPFVIRLLVALMMLFALPATGAAHELRPGFLEIAQTGPERYDIRFKVPARGDARLGLYVRLPSECTATSRRTEHTESAVVEQFVAEHPGTSGSVCDVSDVAQVNRAFDELQALHGRLDVLGNNAGIAGPTGRVEDIEPGAWERTIAVSNWEGATAFTRTPRSAHSIARARVSWTTPPFEAW